MLLALLACTAQPDRYRVLQLQEDGEYALKTRAIDGLDDAARLEGDYGTGYTGGTLQINWSSGRWSYDTGRPLDILHSVREGVAYPLDRDGLVLYSFYAHLEDAAAGLAEAGLDISPLFPIHIAVTPSLSDPSLAFVPAENAAYAPSANTFILLDDLVVKEVPLAANRGVVTHEFGHGTFHYLTTGGDVYGPGLSTDDDPKRSNHVSSLDEGFADMLACLLTDDPASFEASLAVPERDASGDHVAAEVPVLPDDTEALSYDPYPLGTVFASLVWDVRTETDDRLGTLEWVLDGVETWGVEGDKVSYHLLDILYESGSDEQREVLCEYAEGRFEDVYVVEACP